MIDSSDNPFVFKTVMPNGTELELNAAAASDFCKKLEAFGDDCSDGCKKMRVSIREALKKVGME